MTEKLSEYELARLENIKRNEEFLKSVGLYKDPNAALSGADAFKTATKKKKPKRSVQLADLEEENLGPVRRSSRNSGVGAVKEEPLSLSDAERAMTQQTKAKRKYAPMEAAAKYFEKKEPVDGEGGSEYSEQEDEEGGVKRVVLQPNQLRQFIESVNPEHSDMISNSAVQLCAYRCAYMSIAALKNRIKAVSTGGGKKSHEKLMVVTYAMRAMGLHRLADTAAALLKRNTGIVVTFSDTSSDEVKVGVTVMKTEEGNSDVNGSGSGGSSGSSGGGSGGSNNSNDSIKTLNEVTVKTETNENNSCSNTTAMITSSLPHHHFNEGVFVNPVAEPAHITKAKARALQNKLNKQAKANNKKNQNNQSNKANTEQELEQEQAEGVEIKEEDENVGDVLAQGVDFLSYQGTDDTTVGYW